MRLVKGHLKVGGNEEADRRIRVVTWIGQRMRRVDIATPAKIRQDSGFIGTGVYTMEQPGDHKPGISSRIGAHGGHGHIRSESGMPLLCV